MEIIDIHCVLVPPLNNVESDEQLIGSKLSLKGEAYQLIRKVFQDAPRECNIPIVFTSQDQTNPIRAEVTEILTKRELSASQRLFTKLAGVTTNVSGPALCFAIIGELNNIPTILLARFPAVEGIRTEVQADSLEIEVLSEIFLRSSRAYKAALYQGSCCETEFWNGYAVDKQARDSRRHISNYWIEGFLQSEFRLTARRGTNLVTGAINKAMKSKVVDISTKQELVALAIVLQNRAGQRASLGEICQQVSIGQNTKELLRASFDEPDLYDEPFELCPIEYSKRLAFRSVYLDHGGIISAPNDSFNQHFTEKKISQERSRFSTEGEVIDIKMGRGG